MQDRWKPPFVLEEFKPKFDDKVSNKRIFYTKAVYQPAVKNSEWQSTLESRPVDNNPYNPECRNYFLSHYNRLGNMACHCYATTTSDMLRQVHDKERFEYHPKYMMNLVSFLDTAQCKAPCIGCPIFCANDYISETHKSYTTPCPYKMERLGLPKKPWLETRRFKREDPLRSSGKFYDERTEDSTQLLQKYKSHLNKSYDFTRGTYQDGSLPQEKKPRRFCPGYK